MSRRGGGVRGRVRRVSGAGWMDRLPGLFPGHSPNLHDAPAAALSRNDGSGPAWGGGVPRIVKGILQHSLRLRDHRDENEISEPGLAIARGKLEARLDRELQRSYRSPPDLPSATTAGNRVPGKTAVFVQGPSLGLAPSYSPQP